MNEYVILTDSSCDLPQELADSLELVILPLSVNLDGTEYTGYLDGREIGFEEFYGSIREKKPASTSAINSDAFLKIMENFLSKGSDVLYLGFSSGLSATYSVGAAVAAQLAEEYPERKIFTVDTLCASMGQGLLAYLTVQKKLAGASIEEARDFAEETKLRLCHWFTVDDLWHLKRGGRISAAAAAMGSMLNIKPVMHVDNAGRLTLTEKVRGRRKALQGIVARMKQTAIDPENQTVFISHGDCLEDAQYAANLVKSELGVKKDILINYVGSVIGAHSGPGTVALFFLGEER